MKHIRQTKKMACWYASAQMIVQWQREKTQSSISGVLDPSEDNASKILWEVNNGITNPEIMKLAKRIGLEEVPPQSPSEEGLGTLLWHYGPLWVNGIRHIVVIAGIRNEGTGNADVLVYDPGYDVWEPKAIQWRSLSGWYIGNDVSSRDTSNDVQTVFLHCPPY